MKVKVSNVLPGCVFEHYGRIPKSVYDAESFASSLEKAVYENDVKFFKEQAKGGQEVSVRLKIGQMSCIEYAAMMGYNDILLALLEESSNAQILKKYFSLPDVVDRAYMISKNKAVFFNQEALAEANRYEAALYTAIEYNQPRCVEIMMRFLGAKEPGKHLFYTKGDTTESLGAQELADIRGYTECCEILNRRYHMEQ